jgi:hypothetical protein
MSKGKWENYEAQDCGQNARPAQPSVDGPGSDHHNGQVRGPEEAWVLGVCNAWRVWLACIQERDSVGPVRDIGDGSRRMLVCPPDPCPLSDLLLGFARTYSTIRPTGPPPTLLLLHRLPPPSFLTSPPPPPLTFLFVRFERLDSHLLAAVSRPRPPCSTV